MASATYENILRDFERLTLEKRHQLRDELILVPNERADISTTLLALPPAGTFAAALQMSEPIRPEVLDAMEHTIEADFEVIEPND